ncbi:MAG: hypothetical protein QXW47_01335 [Candidatus Jordarchaeales archaeon]|nr:hypothetical protein [Candidatus Jordarchaeia archaeon]
MDENFEDNIWRQLQAQFGIPKINGVRLLLSGKRRIRAASEDLLKKIDNQNVLSVGVYFATLMPDGIRLSVEGSQMVGESAKKNVVEIDGTLAERWIKGENIPIPPDFEGYVIVKDKSRNDFIGCGLAKKGTLINFFPKARRIT